jgi:hypothetical protein
MSTTNPTKLPSNRSFGWLFVAIFVLLAGLRWYREGFANTASRPVWLFAGAALLIAAITLVAPSLLTPFNRAWMKLSEILGKVVSPIVLGIIFFVLITPFALVTRLFGRDSLRLKPRQTASYWIDRTPPGPPPESLHNQF